MSSDGASLFFAFSANLARASLEGGAAIALAWLLCRALPRLRPGVRCWLWRLAYLKLLVALVWTVPIAVPILPPPPSPTPSSSPAPLPSASAHLEAVPAPLPPHSAEQQSAPLPAAPAPVPAPPTPHALPWFLLLLPLYLAGVAWSIRGIFREWQAARRLRAQCRPVTDATLLCCRDDLARRVGVRRRSAPLPALLVGEEVASPLLVGALLCQPAILLPAALLRNDGSPDDLRLVLAHEMAHHQRRDLLWNWLPALAHALFFFHPLIRLAGREWRLAQEMAADERAVLATGAPVEEYGAMLVRVAAANRAASQQHPPRALLTVSVVYSPQTLKRRLIAMKTFGSFGSLSVTMSRRRQIGVGAALALAVVVGIVPWRATASAAQETAAPAAPPKPVAATAPVVVAPAVVPAAAPPAVTVREKKPLRPAAAAAAIPVVRPVAPAAPAAVAPPALPVRPVAAAAVRAAQSAPRAPAAPTAPAAPSAPAALPAPTPAPTLPVPVTPPTPFEPSLRTGFTIRPDARVKPVRVSEQIAALSRQLAQKNLTDAERVRITERIALLSQAQAAAAMPYRRYGLQGAMPQVRQQMERAMAEGKVSPEEMRREVERALAEAQRQIDRMGPEMQRQLQILPQVQRAMDEAIRSHQMAQRQIDQVLPQLRREMEQATPGKKRREMEKAMPEIRRALDEARREMERSLPQMRREMEQARIEIQRAMAESRRAREELSRSQEQLRREREQLRQERERSRAPRRLNELLTPPPRPHQKPGR